VLAVVLGCVAYFICLQFARTYRVAVVNVPATISGRGVTADVARHLLAERLGYLQDKSNTTVDRRFQADQKKLDFTIPQTSLSFQSLVNWTQDLLGHDDTLVSLDFVQTGDQLQMVVQVVDPRGKVQFFEPRRGKDFNELLNAGALDILRYLSPLVSGTAALAIVRDTCARAGTGKCDLSQFNGAIEDLTAETHDPHLAVFHRAFISLADLYAVSGARETADVYLDTLIGRVGVKSVGFERVRVVDVLDAYLMRGVNHAALGEHEAAANDFRFVLANAPAVSIKREYDCDALHSYANEDLAADLITHHPDTQKQASNVDFAAAVEFYRKAVESCPHNTSARAAWGYALFKLDRFTEANETLREVLKQDATLARVHKDLGRSMAGLAMLGVPQENRPGAPKGCGLFAGAIEELNLGSQWGDINRSKEDAAQAYLDLGKTYELCHDLGRARVALSASISRNADYVDAVNELKAVEAAK
jgi:tetratricopeptide (TPR) repeat protein